jgi:hypothetical protein
MFRAARPTATASVRFVARLVMLCGLAPGIADAAWDRNGVPLATGDTDQSNPLFLPDAHGTGHVVWLEPFTSRIFHRYVSTLSGFSFEGHFESIRSLVFDGSGAASEPRAIAGGSSTVIVAWSDDRRGSGSPDIYVMRQMHDGTDWPSYPVNGLPVCIDPASQTEPAISSDLYSGFYVAWTDARFQGATGTDIFIQRYGETGELVSGWTLNGAAVCTAPGDQREPIVIPDEVGGAYVVWRDYRNGATADLYAIRIQGDGSVAQGWPANGIALCDAPGEQDFHVGIADNNGGAYIMWRDARDSGTGPGIYAVRIGESGTPLSGWTAGGTSLSIGSGPFGAPSIARAGASGVYTAWSDAGTDSVRILLVSTVGETGDGWPAGGRGVGGAGDLDRPPGLLPAAGVILSWSGPTGSGADVRAQSFDRDGRVSAFWPPDGVSLTRAAGDQVLPRYRSGGPPGASVIIDDSDGALVAWNDGRSGTDVDIYYQRVTRNGVVAPDDPPCTLECTEFDLVKSVFPNPTRGAISAKVWVPGFDTAVRLDVVDVRGRRVRSVTRSGFPPRAYANVGIDLTGLPSGLYFINYVREGIDRGGGWTTVGHRQVVLVR